MKIDAVRINMFWQSLFIVHEFSKVFFTMTWQLKSTPNVSLAIHEKINVLTDGVLNLVDVRYC